MNNFFEPPLMINGIPLKVKLFNDILDEQTTIALLSKGAISISETNCMPPSDRKRILKNLLDLEDRKRKDLEEANAKVASKIK